MLQKKAPQQRQDPFKALTDTLRAKHGVPWRGAVLEDRRVDYFRGKDLIAYFKDHPAKIGNFVNQSKPQDEQVIELAEVLLRKGLLVKGNRMFKKPKPGKKRLSKWPKKLVPVRELTFTEDAFYAWTYDRPASPWLWLGSGLLILVVIGFCLFPLAPNKVKLGVVYCSASLLILIVSTIVVRALLAAVTWISLGKSLWIFPNLLSDEAGLTEAFWPLVSFEEPEEGKETHWVYRAAVGGGLLASCWLVYSYAPDKGAVRDEVSRAHDQFMEYLNLHDTGREKLAGNVTEGLQQNQTQHEQSAHSSAGEPPEQEL
ncbi:hypothetical protein WJX72_007432 [[Myrmecia] bisecta]|uniref:Translocation protein SEC62 n=1 Tax=[Myrmecia] bisecta TaxID=41462 RepID=A0AAW1PB17_9CHLO